MRTRGQEAKELRARSNECGVWGEVHHGFVYLVSTVSSLSVFKLSTSMTLNFETNIHLILVDRQFVARVTNISWRFLAAVTLCTCMG